MGPVKAIHNYCVKCVGSASEVKNCEGHNCLFYKFRLGKGRPKLKLIRQFCLDCYQGARTLVDTCMSINCPVYKFRMGKTGRTRKAPNGLADRGREALKTYRQKRKLA